MKYSLSFFWIFFTLNSFVYASSYPHFSPSFDCNKTNLEIQKIICKDKELSTIDLALSVIYKKALEFYPTVSSIRSSQIAWIKKRNQEAIIDRYKGDLFDLYDIRISELLAYDKLPLFFLNSFLNSPYHIEPSIVYLSSVALLKKTTGDTDPYNTVEDIINSKFMIIDQNNILLALLTNRGAYREGYSFYRLNRYEHKIKMVPFNLPHPKKSRISIEGNLLTGNFSFETKNGNYFIMYNDRPSSYIGGDHCIWKINPDGSGAMVIEEKIAEQ